MSNPPFRRAGDGRANCSLEEHQGQAYTFHLIGLRAPDGAVSWLSMPRPPRIDFPDALYHVTSRGNGRATIFFHDDDRARFLGELATTCI